MREAGTTPPDGGGTRLIAAVALVALLAVTGACGSGEVVVEKEGSEPVVERFGQVFLDGQHAELERLMADELRVALTSEQAAAFRAQLESELGPVESVGAAWLEDVTPGFRRFRLPVEFERGTIDFRIVIDGTHHVAGFFRATHVDPATAQDLGRAPGSEIEITVGNAENGLPGTLTLPRGDLPFPAVVLVHDFGAQSRDGAIGRNKPLRDLAWGLAARGVAALRYDKRTAARPEQLAALGTSITVREEVVDDARAALDLLRLREEIDANRIFVVGHGLGGMLAPRIANDPPMPAGIIVLAGMTLPLPEKIVRHERFVASLRPELPESERLRLQRIETEASAVRAALNGDGPPPPGLPLGAPFGYFQDLDGYDPAREAAALGLPTLALQGGRDFQVTLEEFRSWQEALGGTEAGCLRIYEDLDHLFRRGTGPSTPADYERPGPVDPRVLDDIARWIKEGRCPA